MPATLATARLVAPAAAAEVSVVVFVGTPMRLPCPGSAHDQGA
jgi:hypothetical protein